jgi:SAM-dependent methyltransferase
VKAPLYSPGVAEPATSLPASALAECYLGAGGRATNGRRADLANYLRHHHDGALTPEEFVLGPHFLAVGREHLGAERWEAHLRRPVERVLDAGCSAGSMTIALADRYPSATVVGVDVEEEAVALARHLAAARPLVSFETIQLERYEPDEGFDVIQCRETLEHVYDPRATFTKLLRLLRPGGVLFVETPNYRFPYEPHVRLPMLPKSPKALLRLECRLAGRDAGFVGHLNFDCDPLTFARWARLSGTPVDTVDLMAEKVQRLLNPESGEMPATAGRARVLTVLRRSALVSRLARTLIDRMAIAPSAMLLFVRRRD